MAFLFVHGLEAKTPTVVNGEFSDLQIFDL